MPASKIHSSLEGNIAENFNRLIRALERYRRQTSDGRATAKTSRSLKTMLIIFNKSVSSTRIIADTLLHACDIHEITSEVSPYRHFEVHRRPLPELLRI